MVKRIICILILILCTINAGAESTFRTEDKYDIDSIEGFTCYFDPVRMKNYVDLGLWETLDLDILRPLELTYIAGKEINSYEYEIYKAFDELYLGMIRQEDKVFCLQWINDTTLGEFQSSNVKSSSYKSIKILSYAPYKDIEYFFFMDGYALGELKISPEPDADIHIIIWEGDFCLINSFPELRRDPTMTFEAGYAGIAG